MDFQSILRRPPAITTGLAVFLVLIQWQSEFERLELHTRSFFSLQLNRLSFYPMIHTNWLVFALDLVAFLPVCAQYELREGTVRTGVVLNIIATIPGIVFCVTATLAYAFFTFDAYAAGLEYWTLPLFAALSWPRRFERWDPRVPIPIGATPVIVYVLALFIEPSGKWYSLGVNLLFGYLLGAGALSKLVNPSSAVVAWIEAKLEAGIALLGKLVHFIGELEVRPRNATADTDPSLNMTNLTAPATLA